MRPPARATLKAIAALMLVGCASPVVVPPVIDQDARVIYLAPDQVDLACRDLVGWFSKSGVPIVRYHACYDQQRDIIVLPHNPPRWLKEHEQRHREGWTHD